MKSVSEEISALEKDTSQQFTSVNEELTAMQTQTGSMEGEIKELALSQEILYGTQVQISEYCMLHQGFIYVVRFLSFLTTDFYIIIIFERTCFSGFLRPVNTY